MSNGQELYNVIVAANVELQNLLSLLISIYADEHALINPPVAGKSELHTLLSKHIKPLKKTVKPYVCKKLFTSEERDTICPSVDAKKLDSSLLFDIFLKVVDILNIDHSIGKCMFCIGACCSGCNHISPGCKKCTGNGCTPTKKRLHPCQRVHCTKNLQECREEHKTICCTSCVTCITCNKTRFEKDIKAILSNPSTPPSTCPWYMFIHSLEMTKCFRDLFGHVTVEECEEFATKRVTLNEEFKICRTPLELEVFLQFLFQQIVDHAKAKLQDVIAIVPSPSPAKLKELNVRKERLNKTMDNLQCFFEHGQFLKKYLADSCSKIEEIFMDEQRFYERLQVFVTQFNSCLEQNKNEIIASVESIKEEVFAANKDKERQNDRNNKVKLVRSLNKGFVLKLPLAKDEDVKVEYKGASDGDEHWKEADADQKRDGGTAYLRVEGLPCGDFQVRLALTSKGVTKSERVELKVEVIKCIQWKTITADGNLTFISPPNKGDEDISSCCHCLDQNSCMLKTTTLAIKVVNADGETNCVSDDELTEPEEFDAEEFSEIGLRYLERNFVNFEDVITFPTLYIIMDDLVREISGKFADLLKQDSEPGLRLVLSNYEDSKFSNFIIGDNVRKLFDGAVPATNRLLLFYSRFATIVNARIVKEKANIHQEMSNCINDFKLFSYTFKFTINKKVIVTGLLVCPHLSREDVEAEMEFYSNKGVQTKNLVKYFFLTKDELESSKDESNEEKSKLTEWWEDVFRKRLEQIFNSKKGMDGDVSKMFKRISGQCMATIACCDVENKSMLPTTSDDSQEQILTLLLSNAQLHAIYAPEKKRLVFGPFGSGKSVIAESVVRNIYVEALSQDKKCLIVHAIQDDHSLLEVKNRRFVNGLKAEMKQRDTGDNGSCSDDLVSIESGTFHSLAGQRADGRNSLLHFVKNVIERNPCCSINLVIDEVDHNSIEGEDGIEEFKKLLDSIDHFVIFPRSACLQFHLPGEEKLQQESKLHRLCLEPYPLKAVMRNSVEIVNLAESSQKTVEKSKSFLQYPSTTFQKSDALYPLEAPDSSTTPMSEEVSGLALQKEIRRTKQVDNAEISSTEQSKKKNKAKVNLLIAAKHIDKQKPSSSKTLEFGSTFIECIPGHKVTKKKPNLINLPETFDLNSDNGAKILSIVLDKVCLEDFDSLLKGPRGGNQSAIFDSSTIICNEIEEVKITYYALTLIPRLKDCYIVYAPGLRKKYFSWKDKEPIYDAVKLGNKILIGDNCSMRGMESRHVITFINPLAKFDQHVLPEVITRANVSLDIISYPVDEAANAQKAATLRDVVNNWLVQKLVDVKNVTASPYFTSQDEICSKENDRLVIHVQSREFQQYDDGHPTFKRFLRQKKEELSTEELKTADIESAIRIPATKLTEDDIGNVVVQTNRKLDILKDGQTKLENIGDEVVQTNRKLDNLEKLMESLVKRETSSVEKHSSTNAASTNTSALKPIKYSFKELNDLLKNESTRDQFNAIIESNPSLTKLRDNVNHTLLHRAAKYGATECVEVLIKNRCDVNWKSVNGWMAIHYAARNNHTQVMKILLSHDPSSVNVTNNNNFTPLHYAAYGNHQEAVELLLSQPSVDVNVRDVIGMTPDERTRDEQIKTMIISHHNYSPRSTTDA